jgi:hypothetical protein
VDAFAGISFGSSVFSRSRSGSRTRRRGRRSPTLPPATKPVRTCRRRGPRPRVPDRRFLRWVAGRPNALACYRAGNSGLKFAAKSSRFLIIRRFRLVFELRIDCRTEGRFRNAPLVRAGAVEPRLLRHLNLPKRFVRRLAVGRAKLPVRDVGDPTLVLGTSEMIDVGFAHDSRTLH